MNKAHALNLTSLMNFLEEFKRPAIQEYRCGSCGDFYPGDMLSDVSYQDWQNGDWVQILMCDPCKLKRRHELLR